MIEMILTLIPMALSIFAFIAVVALYVEMFWGASVWQRQLKLQIDREVARFLIDTERRSKSYPKVAVKR